MMNNTQYASSTQPPQLIGFNLGVFTVQIFNPHFLMLVLNVYFSCLLVGETSQGRGYNEPEEALIHLIAFSKILLIIKHKVLKDKVSQFICTSL